MPNGTGWFFISVFIISGCTQKLIPQELEQEIGPELTLALLRQDIEAQQGKRILLGAEIIEIHLQENKTELELLEKPLTKEGVPLAVDASQGRFILIHSGPLDPMQYKSGRRVTVVGKVLGSREIGLGGEVPVMKEGRGTSREHRCRL